MARGATSCSRERKSLACNARVRAYPVAHCYRGIPRCPSSNSRYLIAWIGARRIRGNIGEWVRSRRILDTYGSVWLVLK
jgi:hypothetical protein